MKTSTGIEVHVVRGDNGHMPLEAQTEREVFARVPEGAFAIRVQAKKPTEVRIELDGVDAFTTRVRAGSAQQIDSDDDGRPLKFLLAAEGSRAVAGEFEDAHVTAGGRVVVMVRHSKPRGSAREKQQVPENPWEKVVYQLQTPGEGFNSVVAGNLHRLQAAAPEEPMPCGNYRIGDRPYGRVVKR